MQLRERLGYIAGRSPSPARPKTATATPFGLSKGENKYGDVFYKDQFFDLDHRHGDLALEDALLANGDLLERLGPDLTTEHIRGAAYLDIETTGLSGGTGTYAFLVGVGTFEALSFRVRQFFLPNPSGEAAMLAGILETVERCQSLVTFNGRSFDIPQLATRFALSRLSSIDPELPHIDLLYPARRLYASSLESCRLSEIERSLMGLRRLGDVPSWMIPDLYFAYVRRNAMTGLQRVLEHNSLDVLSMVTFIAFLNGVAGSEVSVGAAHHLAIARWDETRGRLASAEDYYRSAWHEDTDGATGAEAVRRLTRLVRRTQDWVASRAIWTEELSGTQSTSRRVTALIELAKIAEHRLGRLEEAYDLAAKARRLTETDSASSFVVTRPLVEQRLARLSRRLPHLRTAPTMT